MQPCSDARCADGSGKELRQCVLLRHAEGLGPFVGAWSWSGLWLRASIVGRQILIVACRVATAPGRSPLRGAVVGPAGCRIPYPGLSRLWMAGYWERRLRHASRPDCPLTGTQLRMHGRTVSVGVIGRSHEAPTFRGPSGQRVWAWHGCGRVDPESYKALSAWKFICLLENWYLHVCYGIARGCAVWGVSKSL